LIHGSFPPSITLAATTPPYIPPKG
jgi:hypothetical protein